MSGSATHRDRPAISTRGAYHRLADGSHFAPPAFARSFSTYGTSSHIRPTTVAAPLSLLDELDPTDRTLPVASTRRARECETPSSVRDLEVADFPERFAYSFAPVVKIDQCRVLSVDAIDADFIHEAEAVLHEFRFIPLLGKQFHLASIANPADRICGVSENSLP